MIVYTLPACHACVFTTKWLDRRGIAYRLEPFAGSERAHQIATENGFTAAPIVAAGGKVWSGFRPDLIDQIEAAPRDDWAEIFDSNPE